MKSVFDLLLFAGIERVFTLMFDLVKVEFLTFYVRVIDRGRHVFITGILIILCLMAMLSGFLVLHVALFILLPWSEATKTLLLLVLGLIYFFVPMGLVSWLSSRRRWIEILGAEEQIRSLSKLG